jgi:tripartite-type tricarboxylate transporter receptor subunit TctC
MALTAIAAVTATMPSAAETYPSRPVHIMVGFIAGSAADITARLVGSGMGQALGQQFVVENRPGAGASIAAEYAARAPKDGYTLFIGSSANITNQAMTANPTFDMARDFAPVGLATALPVILVVHPSLGVKSVRELIALAKAKPGEIFYGSAGVGTSPHLAAELFNARAGIKLVHVPYQGSPQAVTDLIAGRTALMFSPASTVIGQVESGTLVALAAASAKRPAALANLPTMEEAGLPDFDTPIWFGLLAPAGTPRDIVDVLAAALSKSLKSPETIAALRTQGFEAQDAGPDDFARFIASETTKWNAAAKAAGLKK